MAISDKITIKLDALLNVSVRGIIAPVEYSLHNFHVKWEPMAHLQAVGATFLQITAN